MNDRDRLIELLQEYTDNNNGGGSNHGLADYLLANGVIVPPCKVGDKVYQIIDMSHTACKSFVSDFAETVEPYSIIYKNIMGGYSVIPFEQFGKTVFLTKEEAEAELRKIGENNA